MVGRKNGLGAKLKYVNPRLISVHCICHKLALVCTDAKDDGNLKFIKEVETVVTQLWKLFENSPKRLACYLKVQQQLKKLKLSNEKSRKMVAKKLKRPLKQAPGQPAAYGLLKKINKVKFIGAVYILRWVLPVLATLSKSFQRSAINYASIKPSIDYTKEKLNDVKNTEEPIKQLKQDLTSGGRLETLELVCTESNFKDLQGLIQKYIKALVKNIDKRFKSSLPVLSAFSAFDPMLIPNRQSPAFHSHGDAEVKVLADHFFDGDGSEADEFKTEWKKLKYDLLSWKEHIPKDTVDGKKGTPTEWSLKRVLAMKSTFGQFYPRSVLVAEAALAIPASNAWPERGASQLKLIKTRIRSQIKNDLLASLLHISINGPVPHTEACDSLVSKAVDMWKAAKKRRKLPHHRPSTQPQANSETDVPTPTTVVQDIGTQTDVTSTTELQNIREEYEEALHVLHLEDMVEEELDSLEAFAKSMETDDIGDSGVDESILPFHY
ncbi:zinc finger protein 862-like [Montipora foliosa]|uniref:zinc finger protein 862-like n=1 Tax=Montipora foliosa TaxID=591990 RepID=UPI0035F19F51